MKIYSWQSELWTRLTSAYARFPHAMLLRGPAGIGKYDFALSLAQSLLCQSRTANGQACDVCTSCHWFLQYNHPDFRQLSPEQEMSSIDADTTAASPSKTVKKSQIISIAQIRELAGFLELSSHHAGGLRVVLVHPADSLNLAAANALLKMLEEPPPDLVFIMVSSHPQRLLPTIMSRCQKIDMPLPGRNTALEWLREQGVEDAAAQLDFAGGAPLSALLNAKQNGNWHALGKMLVHGADLDCHAATVAAVGIGAEAAVNLLQKWVYDLVAIRLADQIRYHRQHASALQRLCKSVDLRQLLDFQRKLDEAHKFVTHPLNHELQMESLFFQYAQLFSR